MEWQKDVKRIAEGQIYPSAILYHPFAIHLLSHPFAIRFGFSTQESGSSGTNEDKR